VIRTENVTGDYLTAFNRARTAWGSSGAGTTIAVLSSASNVIKVENLSATWYGLYTPLQVSGQYVSSFQIQINSRTLERDAPTGSRTNWLQSTMAHEFGHYIFEYDGKSDFADEYSLDKEWLTSETEIRVNRFATALLMPKDIFTDKYRLFHF